MSITLLIQHSGFPLVAFEAVHPVPRVETTAEGEAPLQAVFSHPTGEHAGLDRNMHAR